ncbi:MAG: HIRAN domain-containing protein [Deltaproteobacteria bacterium]|jgi:hypothetical protein|nr:HIRAN domain-containing protein [Deltaproteobacteria bacterium]
MADQIPSIINLDQENVVTLLNDPNALGLPHPFSQQIFLLDIHVAGTSYVQEIFSLTENLKPGDRLDFFREVNNPHDELAIVVKSAGQKIGYVPRSENVVLARLMDAGKQLFGIFRSKEKVGSWLKLSMRIFLDDWSSLRR